MGIRAIRGLMISGLLCVGGIVHAAAVTGQGGWEKTLQGRDLDGDLSTAEAYFDTVLGITWLADADYAGTRMNWFTANSWAAALDPYGSGISGWRLPATDPVNGAAYNYDEAFDGSTDHGYNISAPGTVNAGSTGSEMAHMFYNTLGNLAYYDTSGSGPQAGWGLANTGPFANVQSNYYWSATESGVTASGAWHFSMHNGNQRDFNSQNRSYYAWAVHSGDVGQAVVPVPAAAWLFASALLGLIGLGTRRRLHGCQGP